MFADANVIAGTIALRCGGASTAASHCTAPGYESPNVPTDPFDHRCVPAHSIVSYPSRPSFRYGSNSPSDANRPRVSCITTAYPRSTAFVNVWYSIWAAVLPYGVL